MLYMHVYHDIVNKIYSCKLTKGDKLPSIQKLSKMYNVGNNTIRKAVNMLYENKFIDRNERKSSIIIFDFDNPKNKEQLSEKIKECKNNIIDMHNIGNILIPPVIIEGAKKCNNEDFDELDNIADMLTYADLKKYIELCQNILEKVLSKINNSIVNSLLNIVDISIIIPLILFSKKEKELLHLKKLINLECKLFCQLIRNKNYNLLKNYILNIYNIICDFINDFLNKFNFKDNIKVIDNYKIYYDNNYLYTSIAYDIAEKILTGKYLTQNFLPSENSMCNMYNVSIITIKRALKFLSELGLIKTINGRGSQVILNFQESEKNLFIETVLQQNIYGIFEAIQFLFITAEDITKHISKKIDSISKETLYENFEVYWNRENNYQFSFMILLNCIARIVHSNTLNEIYLIIRKKLIWGAYLSNFESVEKKFKKIHHMCVYAIKNIANESKFKEEILKIFTSVFIAIKHKCTELNLDFPNELL